MCLCIDMLIYILVCNVVIILFLTLLLWFNAVMALQIRFAGGLFVEIESSFFCRSALICSTGLSGGSFCDFVYYISILFGLYLDDDVYYR